MVLNIFTCADVTEAISNYLLENHNELAGSLEYSLDELREQDVDVDVEAQNNILLHGDIIEAMSNFPLENHSEITTVLDNSDYQGPSDSYTAVQLMGRSATRAAVVRCNTLERKGAEIRGPEVFLIVVQPRSIKAVLYGRTSSVGYL